MQAGECSYVHSIHRTEIMFLGVDARGIQRMRQSGGRFDVRCAHLDTRVIERWGLAGREAIFGFERRPGGYDLPRDRFATWQDAEAWLIGLCGEGS